MASRCECENEPLGFHERRGVAPLAEQMRTYAGKSEEVFQLPELQLDIETLQDIGLIFTRVCADS
jgi:uncharacterized protein YjiS (DUF1127 family)